MDTWLQRVVTPFIGVLQHVDWFRFTQLFLIYAFTIGSGLWFLNRLFPSQRSQNSSLASTGGSTMAQQAGVVRGSTKSQSQSQSVSQSGTDWKAIEQTPEFQELLSAKSKFIIPATIFFIVYYFALPVLVGYFPQFMSTNVVGNINIAYIFALSQFFMAWIIMALYIQQAKVFDGMAARIVAMIKGNKK